MKRFLFAAMVAIIAVIAGGYSRSASAEVAVPPLTGRVVDLTGTLTSDAVASLTETLRDFEARKGSQIAVLFVPTTQPEAIEQYSLRVAKDWKIGRYKIDDGVIVVVAKDDHKLRIEVGKGLEGALTNFAAKRIIDENIVPRFSVGDFAGGITAGVTGIIGAIENEQLPPVVHAAQPDEMLASIHTDELLGRWGIASFENPVDRALTERQALAQCQIPYVIHAGKSGGIMMNLADQTTPQELWLKGGPSGKKYIGPPGPTPGEQDREIVWYDGHVMITRFVETKAAARYGNMVYVRCETNPTSSGTSPARRAD